MLCPGGKWMVYTYISLSISSTCPGSKCLEDTHSLVCKGSKDDNLMHVKLVARYQTSGISPIMWTKFLNQTFTMPKEVPMKSISIYWNWLVTFNWTIWSSIHQVRSYAWYFLFKMHKCIVGSEASEAGFYCVLLQAATRYTKMWIFKPQLLHAPQSGAEHNAQMETSNFWHIKPSAAWRELLLQELLFGINKSH